jgi:hypothetical protein
MLGIDILVVLVAAGRPAYPATTANNDVAGSEDYLLRAAAGRQSNAIVSRDRKALDPPSGIRAMSIPGPIS